MNYDVTESIMMDANDTDIVGAPYAPHDYKTVEFHVEETIHVEKAYWRR